MMISFNDPCSSPSSSLSNLGVTNTTNLTPTKKKSRKKPDPTAPKITRPCTECGKKFWSWKALFGHMRCHPERQWRGINPPKNHKETASSSAVTSTSGSSSYSFLKLTDGDHDAALSLLMLAKGLGSTSTNDSALAICSDQSQSMTMLENVVSVREGVVMSSGGGVQVFECSSCKKVFGSHQALGGHRASHKNVKGCFANTRNNDGIVMEEKCSLGNSQNSDGGGVEDENEKMLVVSLGLGLNLGFQAQQHQCNICFKVFSSGQALGGHKRYHWEKFDDGDNNECVGIDLNLPAATAPSPRLFVGDNSFCASLEALDLRLGV